MVFAVKNGDIELYCEKRGQGPNLLLIHGVVCDSDYFRGAAKHLAKNFTVITYDRRGYTRSPYKKDGDYSVGAQTTDAEAVLKAVGGSAYVVGCSAGGVVALDLAVKHPELVKKLMLHEPPIAKDGPFRERMNAWSQELSECAEKRRTAKAMVSFVNVLGGVDDRGVKRPLEEQQQDMKTLPIFLYHEKDSFLHYVPEGVEKIDLEMPCTVAVGEKDEGGLFHETCESTAELLGARLLRVPGYHNFALDLPYDFAVAVTGVMSI